MSFRKDLEEVIGRTRAFHASERAGSALVEVTSIADNEARLPAVDLTRWKFPADTERYLSALFERAKALWGLRSSLRDDRIPSVTAWFGIAEHSAYVGGEVTFASQTSYHHPFLSSWDGLEALRLDPDTPWRRMLDGGLSFLRERSAGECAVSLRGTYSPLEMAHAIRGNDLLTDFYESPAEVRRLLEFCVRAVTWNIQRQKAIVGSLAGGVLSGFQSWVPGNSFGQISEDTSVLTGPTLYEQFGRPYTERAIAGLERLFVHTHGAGAASLRSILGLPPLYMLEISNDPNAPRAIEVCKALDPNPRRIVCVLSLRRREIEENLDFLKRRRAVIWYDAADVEDARSVIELVRRELPV